jgi:hypothetical protein
LSIAPDKKPPGSDAKRFDFALAGGIIGWGCQMGTGPWE